MLKCFYLSAGSVIALTDAGHANDPVIIGLSTKTANKVKVDIFKLCDIVVDASIHQVQCTEERAM